MKNAALDRPTGTELYLSVLRRRRARLAYIVVRTQGRVRWRSPGAVRNEIRALDRALPISEFGTLEEVMDKARSRPRFLTLLLTMFSSLSLDAGGAGHLRRDLVFGGAADERDRHPDGAGRADRRRAPPGRRDRNPAGRWPARRIGAIGAFALTRTLSGLLFGVSSFDVATFVAMAATLIAVTLLACYIPARRAAKVDP